MEYVRFTMTPPASKTWTSSSNSVVNLHTAQTQT